ncbi:MocR-like pyridoxine biosynthesis transcription factor PdxR [Massilia rhizosphaerae]|uniref:MocR-like pyridoxine biosynthesis transcription factor PdxR n=1 Tax=Massilia rhizosphaerae TaxID=2784389 RepID=UPI0018DDDFD0|nr:PLP-dependent aminotransferase family protein [Massilia rhizosphaerae]
MDHDLSIRIDRSARTPVAGQIAAAIGAAIHDGRLAPGARLPSWHDLAAQLGVARGTVRAAYDSLRDQQLIVTAGAAGTRVARQALPARTAPAAERPATAPARRVAPVPFQVGVPGQDVFPFKTWSRIMGRAARAAAAQPLAYPDPRGEPVLRGAIAAYLGIARGIACHPSQVFVANGYAAALGLALRALRLDGRTAWVEDPGYASARDVLLHYGVTPAPVPIDAEGLDVAAGVARAPDALLAVVTPGQQAPLGMTLSLARRHALLDWAAARGAWIVEDDYLGELQLQGRATPALAARDRAGRVLHIGTFSKTISPALRVAFLVVPPALAPAVAEVADVGAAAPAPAIQFAIEEFLRDGHYLRHLRHMKRVYAERRAALDAALRGLGLPHAEAGLSVLLPLADGVDDAALAARARGAGLAPSPLSWWRAPGSSGPGGLLLGVTNVAPAQAQAACALLAGLLRDAVPVPPAAADG